MIWNEQTCAILRQLWEVEGKTSAEIADHFTVMGHSITKNSVIGRAHRMKLKLPEFRVKDLKQQIGRRSRTKRIEKAAASARNEAQQTAKIIKAIKRKQEVILPPTEPPRQMAVPISEAREHHCRAIVGYVDEQPGIPLFCGERTTQSIKNGRIRDTSWCAYHKSKYFEDRGR